MCVHIDVTYCLIYAKLLGYVTCFRIQIIKSFNLQNILSSARCLACLNAERWCSVQLNCCAHTKWQCNVQCTIAAHTVQVSAVLLQPDDEPEVRHRHHDHHSAQHGHDDARPLRHVEDVRECSRLCEQCVCCRLHA